MPATRQGGLLKRLNQIPARFRTPQSSELVDAHGRPVRCAGLGQFDRDYRSQDRARFGLDGKTSTNRMPWGCSTTLSIGASAFCDQHQLTAGSPVKAFLRSGKNRLATRSLFDADQSRRGRNFSYIYPLRWSARWEDKISRLTAAKISSPPPRQSHCGGFFASAFDAARMPSPIATTIIRSAYGAITPGGRSRSASTASELPSLWQI